MEMELKIEVNDEFTESQKELVIKAVDYRIAQKQGIMKDFGNCALCNAYEDDDDDCKKAGCPAMQITIDGTNICSYYMYSEDFLPGFLALREALRELWNM